MVSDSPEIGGRVDETSTLHVRLGVVIRGQVRINEMERGVEQRGYCPVSVRRPLQQSGRHLIVLRLGEMSLTGRHARTRYPSRRQRTAASAGSTSVIEVSSYSARLIKRKFTPTSG